MNHLKDQWNSIVWEKLKELVEELPDGRDSLPSRGDMMVETPPNPDLGDVAFPMFPFARTLKRSPNEIAKAVAQRIAASEASYPGCAKADGAYVNIRYAKEQAFQDAIDAVIAQGDKYGRSKRLNGQRIMCEFSCPNTNKPLHVGHLRNDALGESVSRILKANDAEVLKVLLINDRGIHICKSMLAYQEFGGGADPIEAGAKPDHFVGDFYVKYDQWAKDNPEVEQRARELLRKWEKGEPETTALWKKMNQWAVEGIQETYARTGISFDRTYLESDTYLSGKDEIIKGLEGGIFYKKDDGSVWVDLTDKNLDHKVLLRGDGTSMYITQDIGTAIQRHRDWTFDRLIYVVASDQNYHFQVLFQVLELIGVPWAKNLYHLSYGLVNLPDGRMKSREGTVVDADDLIDQLVSLAKAEIRDKGREGEVDDLDSTAEKIMLGAINYYLLQPTATKDITFVPERSISFTGNTGPYLQYTGARISSILRKFQQRKEEWAKGVLRPDLLGVKEEWELAKHLADYPSRVIQAAVELNPSVLAGYAYDLAKTFNSYYHDNPVLHNEDPDLVVSRVQLVTAVRQVLKNCFELLSIPFLERM